MIDLPAMLRRRRPGFTLERVGPGDLEWAVSTQTSTPTFIGAQLIKVCGEDQVLMTGSFSGTVDFDPGSNVKQLTGTGISSGLSTRNFFIWKLSQASLIGGRTFFAFM